MGRRAPAHAGECVSRTGGAGGAGLDPGPSPAVLLRAGKRQSRRPMRDCVEWCGFAGVAGRRALHARATLVRPEFVARGLHDRVLSETTKANEERPASRLPALTSGGRNESWRSASASFTRLLTTKAPSPCFSAGAATQGAVGSFEPDMRLLGLEREDQSGSDADRRDHPALPEPVEDLARAPCGARPQPPRAAAARTSSRRPAERSRAAPTLAHDPRV
jgi:hypothetical protein